MLLASRAPDLALQVTCFVVAPFHFVMVGSVLTAFLMGLHYWWPKMTGRMYSERLGRLACGTILVGFVGTFLPQFLGGFKGMPRRYAVFAEEFLLYNRMSTIGAFMLALGMFLVLYYLIDSLRNGAPATANPWGAASLEWRTASPPLPHNFGRVPPLTEPYDYSVLQQISEDAGFVHTDGVNP